MNSKIDSINYKIHYPDSLNVSPYSKMHVLGLTATISVALAAIAISLMALVAISGHHVGIFHSLAALQEGGAWALYTGGMVLGIGGGIYMSFKYIKYCQWRKSQISQFEQFVKRTDIYKEFGSLLAQKQVDNADPNAGKFKLLVDQEIDPQDSTRAHMVLHWDGKANYEVFLLRIWGAEEPKLLENESDEDFKKRTDAFSEKRLVAEQPFNNILNKLEQQGSYFIV